MNLGGRTLGVYLAQNLDNVQAGAILDLSEDVETIGNLGWSLDQQVTETSISDCELDALDPTGAHWAWIQANLASSAGNLPGFLLVVLGGVTKFFGIVNFNEIYWDDVECKVRMTGHSWFSMASLEVLNSHDISGNPTTWSRQPTPMVLHRDAIQATGWSMPTADRTIIHDHDPGGH